MRELVIISGGQTGVDRAALDAAISHGVAYQGWCPKGGWAEDAPKPPGIMSRYPALRETSTNDPDERTRRNVEDSDATLVLLPSETGSDAASPGTGLALRHAEALGRPTLIVRLGEDDALRKVLDWIDIQGSTPRPLRLNIAGLRESESAGIYKEAFTFIGKLVDSASRWHGTC